MADEKKVSPSDLRAEAQRLIQSGQMPPIEKLLGVVGAVRQKYHPKIANARQEPAAKPAESKTSKASVNPYGKVASPMVKPTAPDITIGAGAMGTDQAKQKAAQDQFMKGQKTLDELDDQQRLGERKANLI